MTGQKIMANTVPIEQMLTKLSADTVFGTPTTQGETVVIPVAQVGFGFGYGGSYGSGYGQRVNAAKPGDETNPQAMTQDKANEGASGGGGAGGRVTPLGYLRITPQGVQFDPIVDPTRIPLLALLMAAWSVFWITATIRVVGKAIARRKKV